MPILGGTALLPQGTTLPASANAYPTLVEHLKANYVMISSGFLYGGSARSTDAVLANLRAAIS
jgi:hypothetical protein